MRQKQKVFFLIIISILLFTFIYELNERKIIQEQNKNSLKRRKTRSSVLLGWNTTWGTVAVDKGLSLTVEQDTGYIYATGFTDDTIDGEHDLILLKYTNDGTLLWNKTWGSNGHDYANDIKLDSFGNIYVCGSTYLGRNGNKWDYDSLLLKYNSSGDIQGVYTWGGDDNEGSTSLSIHNDNIFLTGHTSSFGNGNNDIYLLQYNTSGYLKWNITWGDSLSDEAYGLAIDSGENIYITGKQETIGADQALLIKFNSTGSDLWNRTWISDGMGEWGWDVITDSSDHVYMAGRSYTSKNHYECFLLKYLKNGTLLWERLWSGAGGAYCLGLTLDNLDNIFMTGYQIYSSDYRIPLLKFNPEGDFIWSKFWNGPGNDRMSKASYYNNTVYLVGYSSSYSLGEEDLLILKYLLNPDNFSLTSDVGNIISQGSFQLQWESSDYATNYSVYADNQFISEIDLSVSKLEEGLINTYYNVTGLSDGEHYFKIVAYNIFGNFSSNCVKVIVDTLSPIITIDSPEPYYLCGIDAPHFSLSVDEPNLQETWYNIDGRSNNYSFVDLTNNGIEQQEWDKCGNGTVKIAFYAKDMVGHTSSKSVIVRKDANRPNVTIHYPHDNQVFGNNAPQFSISASDDNHIVATYYSIQGCNKIECSCTGLFDQKIWDKVAIGRETTITFYAEDSAGNIGSQSVIIIKDPSRVIFSFPFLFLIIFSLIGGSIYIIPLFKNIKMN